MTWGRNCRRAGIAAIAGAFSLAGRAHAVPEPVAPLSEEWSVLGTVTGFHSLRSATPGFLLRVLEADGSASVAMDPIALYVVATNGGSSELEEHVWLLPRTVSKVRRVTATACGLDVVVEVDKMTPDGLIKGTERATLKACFLDKTGRLESSLTLQIVEPKARRESTKKGDGLRGGEGGKPAPRK